MKLRIRLMLLVLGKCPAAEVAKDLGVSEDIVNIAEALYFDIRFMLETTAWIHLQVIMREADRGNFDLAAKMRLAFFGVVADACVTAAALI